MKSIVIIGAGGHAHSILSLLKRLNKFKPAGLVDTYRSTGEQLYGLPVLETLEKLVQFCFEESIFCFCIAIGDNFQRQAMMNRLRQMIPEAEFPVLVDPTAVVAADAQLQPGVVVMAHAHVGAGCRLEQGVLVNTMASIDHDSVMGAFASLAPGAITGGCVEIGDRSFLGLGARVIHDIRIGADTVVGAGALVLKNLPGGVVSHGSPAHVKRSRQPDERYL